MNHPIHSVKYVRKKYKFYQFISVLFAAITIMAALSAAITGFRITQLNNHQQPLSHQVIEAKDNDLKAEIEALSNKSAEYQKQLVLERTRVKSLSAEIETLEKKLQKVSLTPAAKSVPAITSPAPEAHTKAATNNIGSEASTPIADKDNQPISAEPPIPVEPSASQVKEAVQSPAMIDSQTPRNNMAPDNKPIPSRSSMTKGEQPPGTTSEIGIEDKAIPPAPAAPLQKTPLVEDTPTAPATQPAVVPKTNP